jgi:hypothetical protein
MRIVMEWHDAERRLTLRLASGSRMREPLRRPVEVRVAGERKARSVVFDGRPLDVRL